MEYNRLIKKNVKDKPIKKRILIIMSKEQPVKIRPIMYLAVSYDHRIVDGRESGVPGEILGYYRAWQRFGQAPWRELFLPTINMARQGYIVSARLSDDISKRTERIRQTPALR